jgi:hypothetical protein
VVCHIDSGRYIAHTSCMQAALHRNVPVDAISMTVQSQKSSGSGRRALRALHLLHVNPRNLRGPECCRCVSRGVTALEDLRLRFSELCEAMATSLGNRGAKCRYRKGRSLL